MLGRLQHHAYAIAAGLLVTVAVTLFHVSGHSAGGVSWVGEVLLQLEALAYDARLRLLIDERDPRNQPIVIVDLDEASLARFGRWPWPRRRVAELTNALDAAGAAVIAFDVVFAEAERNPVDRLLDASGDAAPVGLEQTLRPLAEMVDGDRMLSTAFADVQSSDVVLGAFLGSDSSNRTGTAPTTLEILPEDLAGRTTLLRFASWTGPPEQLSGAQAIGHVITLPDDLDGVVRRAPLVAQVDDTVVGSLALQAAMRFMFIEQARLEWARQGALSLPLTVELDALTSIAVDERGRVLVPYLGPARTFPYLSAHRVMDGTLSEDEELLLAGAVVFVGTSSIGLYDVRSTPVDRVYPGVEVHATVTEALLDALLASDAGTAGVAFPREPDLTDEFTTLGLIGAGIVLSLLTPFLGALGLTGLLVALLGGWTLLSGLAWARLGLVVPLVAPNLLIVGIMAVNLVRGFVSEAANRKELRQLFDQYVPPEHIERMVVQGEQPTLDGESRVMTVLFADIQGFTSLSEGLAAPELKRTLNDFFNPITRIILEHQGTVDKYVGDMVMAFWNAPLVDPRHREHGIIAALEMLKQVDQLKLSFRERGLPEVDIGIGLNTGMMNVGDMGSDFRRAYTVIGDSVNLASRVEALTRIYGVRALVGEQTRDETEGMLFRFIDRVQVKGKSQPVRIYQPLGFEADVDPELAERVMRFHHAYWLFAERDWDAAARSLDALIEEEPWFLLYRVYRRRIDELRDQDLGDDWDGSVIMNSK